jgi:hypothetical protein
MNLPRLERPERYAGLYVCNFGDHVSVGYTAEELRVLWESSRYADMKAFRIHRAAADGTLELVGVTRESMDGQDALLFFRSSAQSARADYTALIDSEAPPCRVRLELARLEGETAVHVTVVAFDAIATHEVSAWLNRIGFQGGDTVEGGMGALSRFRAAEPMIIVSREPAFDRGESRPEDEVLASTHLAVQR